MSAIRRPKGLFHLRDLRGLLAVLAVITYLLSGALHNLHGLDVTNPSGTSEIALILGGGDGPNDDSALASHHCHGCFSMTIAQLVQPEASFELHAAPQPARQTAITGIVPDTESPPPKHLA